LFGPIRSNWPGGPLRSREHLLALAPGTTIKTGLAVTAKVDEIMDAEMKVLKIHHHDIYLEWFYTLSLGSTQHGTEGKTYWAMSWRCGDERRTIPK